MSFFLNNIQDINKKSFCFNDIDDYDNPINYNYYNYGINKPKKLLIDFSGNILKWMESYTENPIINCEDPNIYEAADTNTSYINYFSLNSNKNIHFFEYEYLIINKLSFFNKHILQFPKPLTFYESSDINHVGFISNPILLDDYKYKSSNIGSLIHVFQQKSIDISDVINIILQITCCLELAQHNFDFCHYNCTIKNFFIYDITKHKNTRTKKYFEFNLPNYGKIFIPGKWICLFNNFRYSRMNINNFPNVIKTDIIQYLIDQDTKTHPTMKYYKFYDIHTLIKDIFTNIAHKKNITGNIDKKTIFTVVCKKMIKEWDEYLRTGKEDILSIKTPLQLIKSFNEMGLASLRLPSNKTISLYNYGNNGKDKRTYLTYNKPEVVIDNKVKKNIDLEDCSWKEIQTIAKEFGLKRKGKGINKAYLKKKIKDELPFY